jgi:hypothetical protein
MKANLLNIILAVVIFTIVASTLLISTTVVQPYSEDTIFARQFPYEGFSNYGSANDKPNTDSMINDYLIQGTTAGAGAECTKVYGFDGLFCKPYVADSTIDKFSEIKGDASCLGKSSGLSNSMGGLCLDDNMQNMLRTRGGNQTGAAMEIGK